MFSSTKKKIIRLVLSALVPVVVGAVFSARSGGKTYKPLMITPSKKKDHDEESTLLQYIDDMKSSGEAERFEMEMIKTDSARDYVNSMGLSNKFYGKFFEWMTTGYMKDGCFKKCKIPKGYPLGQIAHILKNEYLEATNVTPTYRDNFFEIKVTIPLLENYRIGVRKFHITAAKDDGVKKLSARMTPDEWVQRCRDVIRQFTKLGFCKIDIHHVSEGGTLVLTETSNFLSALLKEELVYFRFDRETRRKIPLHISIDNY